MPRSSTSAAGSPFGFIDAHTHLVMMGEALGKVGLTDARSLREIQGRLRAAREPTRAPPARAGWLFDSVPGGVRPRGRDDRRRRRRRARVPRDAERLPLGG